MSSFLSITAALMQVAETIANSILIGMVRTTWQAMLENIFLTLNEIFMIASSARRLWNVYAFLLC